MKQPLCAVLLMAIASGAALGQVDLEHRRTLTLQASHAIGASQERLGGFGYFWFNENNYPRTNTALRVIFAGIYADAELSWFLPCSTNTALGAGLGGGGYVTDINPYWDGRRLYGQEFEGDVANARFFVNQTIPNPTPLPLNVRLSYTPTFQWFHASDNTRAFHRPRDFFTHTLLGEIRFGGIEPGLTKIRGAELYITAETSHRAGFDAFGPAAARYPLHRDYQKIFASLAGKYPVGPIIPSLRVGAGATRNVDALNAWKLGGNLIGTDEYTLTLHGYYIREIFAEKFCIANLDIGVPLTSDRKVVAHLYADNANAQVLDPRTGAANDWHNYLGLGAGLGFPVWYDINVLVSYGYGVNAVRYDRHGGHEIGIALEKNF
jgi:hypothetical protein